MRYRPCYTPAILFAVCFAFATATPVHAQLPGLQPMADETAQALAASGQKSVVVLDFYGPEKEFTQLGRAFAAEFDADLRQSAAQIAKPIQVQDPQAMRGWLDSHCWPSDSFKSTDLAIWVAGQLNVDTVAVGNISALGNDAVVEIDLFLVADRKLMHTAKLSFDLSGALRAPAGAAVPVTSAQFPGVPIAGRNGYTMPRCVECPRVPMNPDALKNHVEGAVVLLAVIDMYGLARDLAVKEALPDGLTEAALKAVRSWQFQPALGPDGKPAEVQLTLRLQFHRPH